jgi:hypothetical protein
MILTRPFCPDKNGRMTLPKHCTAFQGIRRIASGDLAQVALEAKNALDRDGTTAVFIFDDVTSRPIDVDLRGSADAILQRLEISGGAGSPPDVAGEARERRGPGRPRLGVVAREVTLLPRHWDWLNSQPGGASVALRKLVDEARRAHGGRDRVRQAQEAAYRFMSAMAGDEPGYEDATRALFAGNPDRFDQLTQAWPADIRDHARRLAAPAFDGRSNDRR